MKAQKVSEAVIRRLPRYYRHLELLLDKGEERISSSELAQQMGLNPSQVRQDLNCFGGFGQQGYGYQVKKLHGEIAAILGLTRKYTVAVAGAGNIGQALTKYEGFPDKGFEVAALFDVDPALIGREVNGLKILPAEQMGAYIKENGVDIGVIAARRSAAQQIADTMVEAGVHAILNFVPVDLNVPVPLENVQLIDSMYVLSYRIHNCENEE